MKIVIFTITSILLASNCQAQKPQEVDVFKKELLSAWDQKDPHSLDTLFSKDSVNEDANRRYIESFLKHRDSPVGNKIDNLTYISRDEYERSLNAVLPAKDDYEWLSLWFDQTAMIAETGFCFNVPLIGVIQISLSEHGGSHTSLIAPVGLRSNKLCFAGRRTATEQEKADARLAVAKLKYVNTGLLALKRAIDLANQEGKQVSLIVVNRDDREHLMINKKEVPKAELKEFFQDLDKNLGKKMPIVFIDCGMETPEVADLVGPIFESMISEGSLIANHLPKENQTNPPTTSNTQAEQPGAAQPATQPADKPPVKDQPSTPTSKVSPR